MDPEPEDAGPPPVGSRTTDPYFYNQDRYAIGGDWYRYDPNNGHTLTSKPQVFVIRDGTGANARYAAFRIVSYYDENAAESGLFTFAVSQFTTAWSAEETWVLSRNIKTTGPLCVDLFARSEPDCAGSDWQLQLRVYSALALDGLLNVTEPGLFLRSVSGMPDQGAVYAATIADIANLQELPDPTTIPDLEDAPAPDWRTTLWDFAAFAPNLPEAGMALGRQLAEADGGDVFLGMITRRDVARFQLKKESDALVIRWGQAELDHDTLILGEFTATAEERIPLPAPGTRTYLAFDVVGLVLTDPAVIGGATLHRPPAEKEWDLAIERLPDGATRVLTSPGSAVYNHTQLKGTPGERLEDVPHPTE